MECEKDWILWTSDEIEVSIFNRHGVEIRWNAHDGHQIVVRIEAHGLGPNRSMFGSVWYSGWAKKCESQPISLLPLLSSLEPRRYSSFGTITPWPCRVLVTTIQAGRGKCGEISATPAFYPLSFASELCRQRSIVLHLLSKPLPLRRQSNCLIQPYMSDSLFLKLSKPNVAPPLRAGDTIVKIIWHVLDPVPRLRLLCSHSQIQRSDPPSPTNLRAYASCLPAARAEPRPHCDVGALITKEDTGRRVHRDAVAPD
ncbi:hypothetical protein Hypma_012249 [Hypsizygus marmoreus]|uniref:Uncharacterized protein n=1 Tax=Hypsizygus marmoreus TaxID=39966 RepID=A0A369JEQ7_HYPMA|nr:hypothetical protein Hypma_012249 [Hypsizygus marmoreus]